MHSPYFKNGLLIATFLLTILSFTLTLRSSGSARAIATWVHSGCALICYILFSNSHHSHYSLPLLYLVMVTLLCTAPLVPSALSFAVPIFYFGYHLSGCEDFLMSSRSRQVIAVDGLLLLIFGVYLFLIFLSAFANFCAFLIAYLPHASLLRWRVRVWVERECVL